MSARDALAAIRERAEAATEGPWMHREERRDGGRIREHSVETSDRLIAEYQRDVNAGFIAHARTDVPALVEALEAVLAVLDAPDPDEHEHDESVYLERANDRLDNIRSAIETALEGR